MSTLSYDFLPPGFVPVPGLESKDNNPPRYASVPPEQIERQQYKKGPDGNFWQVSPFSRTPWTRVLAGSVIEPSQKHKDVVMVYGPRPTGAGTDGKRHQQAVWDDLVRRWGGIVKESQVAEYFDAGQENDPELAGIQSLSAFAVQWGMGAPVYFYYLTGLRVVFPGNPLRKAQIQRQEVWQFMPDVSEWVRYPHLVVVSFQTRMIGEGLDVDQPHPFLPLGLLPAFDADRGI